MTDSGQHMASKQVTTTREQINVLHLDDNRARNVIARVAASGHDLLLVVFLRRAWSMWLCLSSDLDFFLARHCQHSGKVRVDSSRTRQAPPCLIRRVWAPLPIVVRGIIHLCSMLVHICGYSRHYTYHSIVHRSLACRAGRVLRSRMLESAASFDQAQRCPSGDCDSILANGHDTVSSGKSRPVSPSHSMTGCS